MKRIKIISLSVLISAVATISAQSGNVRFSAADFTCTPFYSTVVTFAVSIELDSLVQTGLVSDPVINDIQYSVSGKLTPGTPSGFPAFAFQLNHKFPQSPPITGEEFYALNTSSVPGGTLQYAIAASADLSDGLQVSELDELPVDLAAGINTGVVFHFNAREEGSGRYHPMILQLKSDGSGILQNANNSGGTNPATLMVVDVDFGEEYITDLSFVPSNLTLIADCPVVISETDLDVVQNLLSLTWGSSNSAVYEVAKSTNLVSWETISEPVFSQGLATQLAVSNALNEDAAFFVIREPEL